MHFNTSEANIGDTALLESRLLYPKRGYQCLQFFSYSSEGSSDVLKVYVREYDKANPNGTLRLIKTIDGDCDYSLLKVKTYKRKYCLLNQWFRLLLHQDPLRGCGSSTT